MQKVSIKMPNLKIKYIMFNYKFEMIKIVEVGQSLELQM